MSAYLCQELSPHCFSFHLYGTTACTIVIIRLLTQLNPFGLRELTVLAHVSHVLAIRCCCRIRAQDGVAPGPAVVIFACNSRSYKMDTCNSRISVSLRLGSNRPLLQAHLESPHGHIYPLPTPSSTIILYPRGHYNDKDFPLSLFQSGCLHEAVREGKPEEVSWSPEELRTKFSGFLL